MKLNTLIYTPYIVPNNNFGYQPKYLGKISNYRSVQEVPVNEEVEEEPIIFTPAQDTQEQNIFIPQRYTPKPGFENAHQKFIQWYRQSGAPENEMDFGSRIAQDESGFIPTIQNSMGYNAFGLFGMLEGDGNGKNMSVVSTYSGAPLSVFLQNPILQIQAAQNMKNHIMHQFTEDDLARARELGYKDSALIAGAGAGGVGGVRNGLYKGKNAVDVMLKNSKDQDRRGAASVAGRMEALNDYFKKGGVLKFSTGGGFERYIENSRIKKGRFGLKMESPETDNLDLFGMSEYHGYTPTGDDLYNFTASYETFNPKVYGLKDNEGNPQELIGHGIALSRVDPETAKRWRNKGITKDESLEWMRNEYKRLDDYFSNTVKNYKHLPMELRVPILDAAYNTSATNFFTKSENLKGHVENGDHYVTIAAELDHSMNHSADENDKNLGSWLAVRSAARRAMALGEYNYDGQHKDKYGRHILPGKSGPQDGKFSPYYNKYKNLKTKHAIYFR